MKRILAKLALAALYCAAAVLLAAAVFYFYQNRRPDYIRLSTEQKEYYAGQLRAHGLAPAAYVAASVKAHRVVILGEPHRVREHYLFVADALGAAHAAGASCLAMELFHASAQKDIDKLLRSPSFDQALARRIVLHAFPGFYYEELGEILKKAWEVNRRSGPFGIAALGGLYDEGMAAKVAETAKKGKVLVLCGSHHAFTRYIQPGPLEMVNLHDRVSAWRMGGLILNRFKVDAVFIQLHFGMPKKWWVFAPILLYQKGYSLAFSGMPDQVFKQYGKPVGFDSSLAGFAAMPDTFSYYSAGYGSVTLSQYCDGYIYLMPLWDYTAARPLPGLGEREGDLQAAAEGIDAYYKHRKGGYSEKVKARWLGKGRLAEMVAKDGYTPQKMLRALDLRGLEDLH